MRLPKVVVEQIYEASLRFAEVLETLEVTLDQKTMRRIKTGEREFRSGKYITAKGTKAIRKVLST